MAHRMWTVKVDDRLYTVVARWSPWTFAGELIVDGAIVKTWGGPRLTGPDIAFQIEGHPALLRNTLISFDLLIDGKKIKYQ